MQSIQLVVSHFGRGCPDFFVDRIDQVEWAEVA